MRCSGFVGIKPAVCEYDGPLLIDCLIDPRQMLLAGEALGVLKQDIFIEPVVGVLPHQFKMVRQFFYCIVDHPEFLCLTEDFQLVQGHLENSYGFGGERNIELPVLGVFVALLPAVILQRCTSFVLQEAEVLFQVWKATPHILPRADVSRGLQGLDIPPCICFSLSVSADRRYLR